MKYLPATNTFPEALSQGDKHRVQFREGHNPEIFSGAHKSFLEQRCSKNAFSQPHNIASTLS